MIKSGVKYQNTLVTSIRLQSKLERVKEKNLPKWLLGVHVISDYRCPESTAYHFDAKGEMNVLDSRSIERELPNPVSFVDPEEGDE